MKFKKWGFLNIGRKRGLGHRFHKILWFSKVCFPKLFYTIFVIWGWISASNIESDKKVKKLKKQNQFPNDKRKLITLSIQFLSPEGAGLKVMAVKTDYKMYNKQRREFSTSENNVCYKFDFSFFRGKYM